MRVSGGGVSGYLALADIDRANAVETYALRIENDSPHALKGWMQLATRRGFLDVAPVQVAPFSIKETLVPVHRLETGPYDRAIVEVHGDGCELSIEAAAPPRSRRRAWKAWIAASAVSVAGLSFAAAWATPRIGAFDAPARAIAGSAVDVPYAAAGVGALRYDVTRDDGIRVAAGIVDARTGTLNVAVPAAETLRLQLDGPFGSVRRVAHISVVPRGTHVPAATAGVKIAAADPQADSPLIADMSVAPSPVKAGSAMRVTTASRAVRGEVWLLDMGGTLWSRTALDPSGTTWVHVPANAGGREMRVVVHASDGKHQAASGIAVVVAPSETKALADSTTPARTEAPARAALSLSKSEVAGGESVSVFVRGPHDDVHVTLTDKAGTVLAQGDLGAQDEALSLVAPVVRSATTYYVVAAVTRGASTDSLVSPLRVTPALGP
jgi:hypothetical protein